MHKLLVGVLAMGALLLAPPGTAQGSDEAGNLAQPRPSWLTAELEAQILAAGPSGLEVRLSREQATETNCLGTSPPYAGTDGVSLKAVSAGGCMVSPSGCTMNFIFERAGAKYIGTAGHCLGGGRVIMQVSTRVDPTDSVIVGLAEVGRVAKRVDGGIGRDFGLVKIDSDHKVVPGVAGGIGPTGVFCGDPLGQPVIHYGHGYVFAVEQGVVKFGEVILDAHPTIKFESTEHGFNWVGYGLPGDSGSGVMNAAGLAVGDLTHGLAPLGVPIPGLNFGMTMGGIFDLIGSGYSLVTADGRRVDCAGGSVGVL